MSNKFFVFVSYFRIIVFIMCVICYAFFACKKKGIILSGDNIMVEKMKLLIKDYNIPINIVINIFAVFVFWCCLKGEIIPGIKDLFNKENKTPIFTISIMKSIRVVVTV
mgnify:CR=1 FL=1